MKKLFTAATIFLSIVSFSQNHELGKVTIEELKEKVCPLDTSAVAAVLFKNGKTSFHYDEYGYYSVTEVETKIKIYKKEGFDFANQSVWFYVGGEPKEEVTFSKAVTYNLNGNNIVKTKLKSDGEFIEKKSKYNNIKKITFPDVKEGSIIEFKYELKSSYFRNFRDWKFQTVIPTLYSEYKTFIPEHYTYNPLLKGNLTPKKTEDVGKNSFVVFDRGTAHNVFAANTLSTSQKIEFNEKRTTYVLENIPALKEESYVNNINNYTSTLVHELSAVQFPGDIYRPIATTWEAVTKGIYENEHFGGELNKDSYFEDDLNKVISGIASNQDRMKAIFDFVKDKMSWNEYTNVFCDDGVKTAYKNKTGNTAEINLILIAMLRKAGVDANPVLVSTRDNGIAIFPSLSAYNSVIAGVENNGQIILLDATKKYTCPDILPIRDLNWFGKLIKKDGTSLDIDLMPKTNSKDVYNLMGTINSQGEVSGKLRKQYFDYNAFLFRQSNNSVAKDSYIERLEKRYQGLEVGDYEVQNSNDLTLPIVENYAFTYNNSVEIIGDKMYISPLLFFTTAENPFKQEKREYPIDFVYPTQDKYTVSLTIPDGYIVETLPKPEAVALPGNVVDFKYNISTNNNQVQMVFMLDVNQAIVGPEYYAALKDFYKEIVNKQAEKIVIKKS